MKHKHHITPKHRWKVLYGSLEGCDDPTNIELLTVEEHAEVHRTLYEKYGRIEDKLAWLSLSSKIGKEEFHLLKSSIGGQNNKNKMKSKAHKRKISKSIKVNHSKGIYDKISKSMKGNKNSRNHSSLEYRKKQSEVMRKYWAKKKRSVA